MKNKLIITVFGTLLFLICGCVSSLNFSNISRKIYEKNSGDSDISTFKIGTLMNDAREKVKDEVTFLRRPITDTLYLIEAYDIETGTVFGEVWDLHNSIKYSYFNEKLELNTPVFTRYTHYLIEKWDTVGIQKEENINGNLSNRLLMTGTRCYKVAGSIKVDQIFFKEFFDLNRDR